jgi:phenylacetate-CoA ligase
MAGALHALDATLKGLNIGERFVRRNPIYYGSMRRQLEVLQTSTREERMAWTAARLRKVLKVARSTRYGSRVGASENLVDWPMLHKTSVRDDPHSFHARGAWFAARASTGGTTGTPVRLLRSPGAVVVEQICRDRMLRTLGVDPFQARIAVLRADSIKDPADQNPPYWKHVLGGRRLVLSSSHLSAATLPAYLDAIRDFRAEILWVHPSMLEVLCRLLKRSGETLQIRGVLASSEVLRPEVWLLAESLLGCRIVDCYGQAERVSYAHASTPQQYYFLPGYAYVELLPHSQDEGGSLFEIVGTSLWNLAMPLVRYRTGDVIRIRGRPNQRELEEIAYGLRPFSELQGRSRDVLLTPDCQSIIPGLSHIPRGIRNLLRLQIIQERPDHIILRALTTEDFSQEDAEHLTRNARQKIPAMVRIDVQIADTLYRTAGGKTPFVIHSAAVREAFAAAGLEATSHSSVT